MCCPFTEELSWSVSREAGPSQVALTVFFTIEVVPFYLRLVPQQRGLWHFRPMCSACSSKAQGWQVPPASGSVVIQCKRVRSYEEGGTDKPVLIKLLRSP